MRNGNINFFQWSLFLWFIEIAIRLTVNNKWMSIKDTRSSYPRFVEILYLFASKNFRQGFSISFDLRFTFPLNLIFRAALKYQ